MFRLIWLYSMKIYPNLHLLYLWSKKYKLYSLLHLIYIHTCCICSWYYSPCRKGYFPLCVICGAYISVIIVPICNMYDRKSATGSVLIFCLQYVPNDRYQKCCQIHFEVKDPASEKKSKMSQSILHLSNLKRLIL